MVRVSINVKLSQNPVVMSKQKAGTPGTRDYFAGAGTGTGAGAATAGAAFGAGFGTGPAGTALSVGGFDDSGTDESCLPSAAPFACLSPESFTSEVISSNNLP